MLIVSTNDGVELYYEMHGSGEAIVFVHEYGGDYRSWQQQVDFFSANYCCITFSARGFKPSSIPTDLAAYGQRQSTNDVLALINALGIEKAHFIGTSMGSFTSLDFALNYPQRVISLTLVGNSSGPRDDAEREIYRTGWIIPETERRQHLGTEGGVNILEQDPAYRTFQTNDPERWQIYADNLREQSVQGALHVINSVHWNRRSLWQEAKRIASFNQPVLLVYGDEDYFLVGETNRYLHHTFPNSRLHEFQRTGHLVNIEQTQAFNRLYQEFIRLVPINANEMPLT